MNPRFRAKAMRFLKRHRKTVILLVAATLLGLAVRLLYFPDNIYFGYDQARDAFVSQEIFTQSDIRVQGPSSSMKGVFHGPLLYYAIGILYTIGRGNPFWVALFFILLNTALIPIMYVIGYALTKRPMVGIVAATLFAFSFEQTQWAIFISNTSLALFGIGILLCGLTLYWFLQKAHGLVLAAAGFTIAVQSEVYLFYLLLPLFALWFVQQRLTPLPKSLAIRHLYKTHRTIFIIATVVFLSGFTTYIAAEILFRFPILRSLLTMSSTTATDITPYEKIPIILNRYGLISFNTFFGYSTFFALALFLLLLVLFFRIHDAKIKTTRLLLVVFLFGNLILLFFQLGFANIYHFSIGVSIAMIILMSVALGFYLKQAKLLVLCIVFLAIGQLKLIHAINPQGASLTLVQKNMRLGDEKRIVAYIADQALREPVGVTALTNPYNVNTVWAYTFKTFWPEDVGKPTWVGNFARGFPGETVFLESNEAPPCTYFVIYEPKDAIPEYITQSFIDIEESRSFHIDEMYFGAFRLEKRQLYSCEYQA